MPLFLQAAPRSPAGIDTHATVTPATSLELQGLIDDVVEAGVDGGGCHRLNYGTARPGFLRRSGIGSGLLC